MSMLETDNGFIRMPISKSTSHGIKVQYTDTVNRLHPAIPHVLITGNNLFDVEAAGAHLSAAVIEILFSAYRTFEACLTARIEYIQALITSRESDTQYENVSMMRYEGCFIYYRSHLNDLVELPNSGWKRLLADQAVLVEAKMKRMSEELNKLVNPPPVFISGVFKQEQAPIACELPAYSDSKFAAVPLREITKHVSSIMLGNEDPTIKERVFRFNDLLFMPAPKCGMNPNNNLYSIFQFRCDGIDKVAIDHYLMNKTGDVLQTDSDITDRLSVFMTAKKILDKES